ncbi:MULTISPECIES: conjugal transfer protein TrbD [Maridesulfovibrio]|uniref:Type IV secretion system protein VirB3 n=1 Tax=Maridesulfovibrio ferrireducens TaxID=246191 RepID=A0A1G9EMV8_9BACT|nr:MULTISPECIES: conjugal transfer protein TrbD [Maridesulfovibrio]OEU68040.1 MAG: conjugal transfer protein TrbD [Desulfovibrio sp. S3730MH75]SDK77381.1 type IV secretion system protein VirB3 [Maridesulfovibrio ferrireducens]
MRVVPIHRSLHKPSMVMGAERELVMFSALISILVGIGGFTLLSALAGLIFWMVTIFILRQMAKSDPQMSKVWWKHHKQQDYYSARATPWRN